MNIYLPCADEIDDIALDIFSANIIRNTIKVVLQNKLVKKIKQVDDQKTKSNGVDILPRRLLKDKIDDGRDDDDDCGSIYFEDPKNEAKCYFDSWQKREAEGIEMSRRL